MTREKIVSILEAHKPYGGDVMLAEGPELLPPTYDAYKMVFTFTKTTGSHHLSLKRIIDELQKIGKLNHIEYRGLKGSRDDQCVPELHFDITIDDGNYAIIFALPEVDK